MDVLWERFLLAYTTEQVLRKTEVDGPFRRKVFALKESLKAFEDQWNAFTKKEMEFFLQYTLDGVASREFFLARYQEVMESFDPNRSWATAREKFSQRLKNVISEQNPKLTKHNGKSIYDGGKTMKNLAVSELIHWLMMYWKNHGGKPITNYATHPAIYFIKTVFEELIAHAISEGADEHKAFLEKNYTKITSVYRRLAKEYVWGKP